MDLALAGSETTTTNGLSPPIVQRQTQANTDQAASNSDSYANVTAYGGKSIQEDNKDAWVTLAAPSLGSTINLDQISVGVFITTLENVSFLRAQNGGTGHQQSHFVLRKPRPAKNQYASRTWSMIDVDIDRASDCHLATYNVLSQAAASMIAAPMPQQIWP